MICRNYAKETVGLFTRIIGKISAFTAKWVVKHNLKKNTKKLACNQLINYICNMNSKKKEKLGDLALDIAKYIITAVLIATWFNRTDSWEWYDFIIPIFVVFGIVWLGLYLIDNDNKKKGK